MDNLKRLHTEFKEVSYPTAFYRAFPTVGCAFAARSGEPKKLMFENFEERKDKDGKVYFQLSYKRSKQTGGTDETDTFCLIKGKAEVEAILNWMSFFEPAARTGTFFRYVKLRKDGKWRATKEVQYLMNNYNIRTVVTTCYLLITAEYWEKSLFQCRKGNSETARFEGSTEVYWAMLERHCCHGLGRRWILEAANQGRDGAQAVDVYIANSLVQKSARCSECFVDSGSSRR